MKPTMILTALALTLSGGAYAQDWSNSCPPGAWKNSAGLCQSAEPETKKSNGGYGNSGSSSSNYGGYGNQGGSSGDQFRDSVEMNPSKCPEGMRYDSWLEGCKW